MIISVAPPSAPPLAVLDIDLASLADNLAMIGNVLAKNAGSQSSAPEKTTAKIAAILKADAYGIGLEEVASIHQKAGTELFFVATPEEGERLRRFLGRGPEIAVLCGLIPAESGFYRQTELMPVLNSLDQLAEWKKEAPSSPAMLHLDTGMNRLGLDGQETRRLLGDLSLLDGVRLRAIISHFACADEEGNPMTMQQKHEFDRITAPILHKNPHIMRSLSNSAGVFAYSDCNYDFVRPGMAVYGLNPTPNHINPMKSVVGLRARILQIRSVAAGETIGYGAAYRATPAAWAVQSVATVGLGYADGFLRSLGDRGTLFWNGQECPVLGRVSMDLVSVDITGLTGKKPETGDFLEVLGSTQDVDMLAAQGGTIGYEILTALGARYQRRYHR